MKKKQKVGIITASKQSLTHKHLAGVGIESYPMAIIGMDESEEFAAVFIEGKETVDVEKCRREMVSATEKLIDTHPDVGAIVLAGVQDKTVVAEIKIWQSTPYLQTTLSVFAQL